jgi:hypothetical protein
MFEFQRLMLNHKLRLASDQGFFIFPYSLLITKLNNNMILTLNNSGVQHLIMGLIIFIT